MLRTIRISSGPLLLAAVLPAVAWAQTPIRTGGALGTSTCSGDKVQLAGFNVTPAHPAVNQNVTITVTVKNLCGSTLNIPYKISDGSTTVNSGTTSVAATKTAVVQINWVATQGNHAFDAYLNAGNPLGETSAALANNGLPSPVVFTVAPPAPPPMETKRLSYESAKQAGATYPVIEETVIGCVNKESGSAENLIFAAPATVYGYVRGGPPCGRVSFEAFRNFSLKNGWKVKSIQVAAGRTNTSNADWEWVTRPAEGSVNPFAKFRIKTTNNLAPLDALFGVTIMIEGPQGTSPY